MVLISLAIVFAGLGAMSLSSSDSSDASADSSSSTTTVASTAVVAPSLTGQPPLNSLPGTTAPATTPPASTTPPVTTTTPPVTTTPPPTTAPAGADKSVPVRVYNNGVIAGLAAQTGGQLTASGWNVTETGNYANGVIPKTTVYYGGSAGEQAAAVAIAKELGANAEPRFPGIADNPPGVIVIVTGN